MDRQRGLIAPPHAGASGFTGVTGATGQTGVTGARNYLFSPLIQHVVVSSTLEGVQVVVVMGLRVSMRRHVQALVASPA